MKIHIYHLFCNTSWVHVTDACRTYGIISLSTYVSESPEFGENI